VLEPHIQLALFPPHQADRVAVAVVKLLSLMALLLVQQVKVVLAVLETKVMATAVEAAVHLR
jgi:hypothetical protein